MDKILKRWGTLLLALTLTGCHYLDVSPDLGLTDEDVFSTYKNFKAYFDYVFADESGVQNLRNGYPLFVDCNDRRYALVTTTDAADCGRLLRAQQQVKSCNLAQDTMNDFTFDQSRRPIVSAMLTCIRIANKTLENIDLLTNATTAQRNDLLGQAYFVRAYAHFALCRFCGGMPYIDKALGADDEWDLPRLSSYETYVRCAEDFYTAYTCLEKAGKMRRDGKPGEAGHLTGSEMDHPGGCAALGMRARALLYAASPLSNQRGIPDWEEAADAAALAIAKAREWGYDLVPFEEYTNLFYGKKANNETLFQYNQSVKITSSIMLSMYGFPMTAATNSGGTMPTQNFVDRFETADGRPLRTEAERAEAVAAGSYADQDPYTGRDPRFYVDIVYDGMTSRYVTGTINIYYDPYLSAWPTTSISGQVANFGMSWGTQPARGYSCTGYYCGKYWRGDHGKAASAYVTADPIVRLAELYLDYAEAVNEAYGPGGTAGGLSLTAVQAVDLVRERAQMPPVRDRYTASADAFRERIHNERDVELAYEGNHYYFDIRRWKEAPTCMKETLMGMYIEKVDVSETYPRGRRYERRAIPSDRQATWKDAMYWWPIPDAQANTMKHFVNNDPWM